MLLPAASRSPEGGPNLAISKAQWQEDLKYFAKELPKRHKNLFHTMSREQFDQAVAELEAAIPSLAGHQILVHMRQITAKVGDGHTGVHLSRSLRRYPLALYWFGNELRVVAATREYERALGTRVVKIGSLTIDEVESRIRTCLPTAENENQWFVMNTSQALINIAEVLHALGVVSDLESAPFTFEDDAGRQITLTVSSPVPDGTLAERFVSAAASETLTRQKRGEKFWYTWLPESRTVYVSFRGYDSLGSHGRELYKFIDDKPTDRLVIDMRQNGGGDFFEGREHIIEPLTKRAGLNQKGKVFVAIGRQTFSAAMVNAIDFHKMTNALLVGEPAGERPNSYSENDEMTLPNSKIVVSYSTRYYKFLDEDAPAVMPDQRIDPSWEDFKAGRDPVMEWILAYKPAGG
jgi:hypothetical protein